MATSFSKSKSQLSLALDQIGHLGLWPEVWRTLAGIEPSRKGSPCPICRDGTDRFKAGPQFETDGKVFCQHCGLNSLHPYKQVAKVAGRPEKEVREAIVAFGSAYAGESQQTKRVSKSEAGPITLEKLTPLNPNEAASLKGLLAAQRGISPKSLLAVGAVHGVRRAIGQNGEYKLTVIGLPVYSLGNFRSFNYACFLASGKKWKGDKPASTKLGLRSEPSHPKDGVLIASKHLDLLKAGKPVENLIILCVEGVTDLLATISTLLNRGEVAKGYTFMPVTNAYGCSSFGWLSSMVDRLTSLQPEGIWVIRDADKPGVKSAQTVAKAFAEVATTRILTLPSPCKESQGADLRDFIAGFDGKPGWTFEDIFSLAQSSPTFEPAASIELLGGSGEGEETSTTNEQAVEPIANFVEVVEDTEEGEKRIKKPLTGAEIVEAIHAKYSGWPKALGKTLFVLEDDKSTPHYLANSNELFSWLREYSSVRWSGSQDFVSQSQLYATVARRSEKFESVEVFPHYPSRIAQNFYSCRWPDPGEGKYLEQFLDFFAVASDVDRQILRALIATVFWAGPPGARPLFHIAAPGHAQGSGKSTLLFKISKLAGGHIEFQQKGDAEKERTRLLSGESSSKRIIIIDNIKATSFSSASLESLITSSVISGHRMYAGEASRSNYFTFIVSMNDAAFSRDLAQRSVTLNLIKPPSDGGWTDRIDSFIESHRWDVIADLAAFFARPTVLSQTSGRWATWQKAIVGRLDNPAAVVEAIEERSKDLDSDEAEAYEVARLIESLIGRSAGAEFNIALPTNLVIAIASRLRGERVSAKAASQQFLRLSRCGPLCLLVKNPDTARRGFLYQTAPDRKVDYQFFKNWDGELID